MKGKREEGKGEERREENGREWKEKGQGRKGKGAKKGREKGRLKNGGGKESKLVATLYTSTYHLTKKLKQCMALFKDCDFVDSVI